MSQKVYSLKTRFSNAFIVETMVNCYFDIILFHISTITISLLVTIIIMFENIIQLTEVRK